MTRESYCGAVWKSTSAHTQSMVGFDQECIAHHFSPCLVRQIMSYLLLQMPPLRRGGGNTIPAVVFLILTGPPVKAPDLNLNLNCEIKILLLFHTFLHRDKQKTTCSKAFSAS